MNIRTKRWTDKVLPSPLSWNHGFWLANLQMPNQLSVSVPYRWLLLFSRNFTISNRFNCPHFSFFFSFVAVFVSRIGNVWTLHLQSKIDSTDQTVEHDQEVGWRLCCASAFGLFCLDIFDEQKSVVKRLRTIPRIRDLSIRDTARWRNVKVFQDSDLPGAAGSFGHQR